MYAVINLNPDVANEEGRAWVGNIFIGLVFLNVFLNFFFLFRTVFLNKVEKQFKKGENANRCFLALFWPCSRKLENLRKKNKRVKIKQADSTQS